MKDWKTSKNALGAEVSQRHGDGFTVSYLSTPSKDWDLISKVMGRRVESKPETALIINDTFYILNGDHRKGYDPLIEKGVDACLAYYEANKFQRSDWSNDSFDEWMNRKKLQ